MAQAEATKLAGAVSQDGIAQLAGNLEEIQSTLERIARALEATGSD